jgi:hypothetical protein
VWGFAIFPISCTGSLPGNPESPELRNAPGSAVAFLPCCSWKEVATAPTRKQCRPEDRRFWPPTPMKIAGRNGASSPTDSPHKLQRLPLFLRSNLRLPARRATGIMCKCQAINRGGSWLTCSAALTSGEKRLVLRRVGSTLLTTAATSSSFSACWYASSTTPTRPKSDNL